MTVEWLALAGGVTAVTQVATAAWVTILAAAVTGLFGLLAGTAAGAVVTTRHQRGEAARERLVSASVDYVAAYNRTSAAYYDFRQWITDLVENDARLDSEGVDFPKVVFMHVDRSLFFRRFLDQVTPEVFKLREAAARVSFTFPKEAGVDGPLDEIDEAFSDDSKLYGGQLVQFRTLDAYNDKMDRLYTQRADQHDLLVGKVREATAVRRSRFARLWGGLAT